ncbi:beta family protein [Ruminiclostridium cellobioparum]|uniref:beta family protein n=1 Tax=Ruminiclostridium cellobioparum TaxID=29355 RepID=UPI0028AA04FB|nr:hypothetical protein [Ruminiclostridium cellobioparum]
MQRNVDYVPVLKWKSGEKESINRLYPDHKNRIIPLIELVDSINASTLSMELDSIFTGPILIDNLVDSNYQFFKDLFSNDNTKHLIPVFYIDDLFDNPSIVNSFAEVAIRLPVPEPIDSLSYATFFSKLFTVTSIKITIILDLIFINNIQTATLKYTALQALMSQLLKYDDNINNIVISSTSFPEDLTALEAGSDVKYKRYEFMLFNKVKELNEIEILKNKLIYSDYGINKFTDTNIDFSKLQYGVLPKIKYTTDEFYYIQKAEKDRLKNVYTVSVYDMAKKIVDSDFFYGKDFSFGDSEIFDRSEGKKGPGGNTNWVTYTTTHHIAVVLNQLSNHLST